MVTTRKTTGNHSGPPNPEGGQENPSPSHLPEELAQLIAAAVQKALCGTSGLGKLLPRVLMGYFPDDGLPNSSLGILLIVECTTRRTSEDPGFFFHTGLLKVIVLRYLLPVLILPEFEHLPGQGLYPGPGSLGGITREIEWLVCVGDHIVELTASCQTLPDGTMVEVMSCRQRSDLFLNLPALRKLDNMLLEMLDGFTNTEFWYVDKGKIAPEANGAVSFQKAIQRQEDKWWLPVPRVPHGGLPEDVRKQLNHRRECANQIHKAAMAINSIALAEMEVPEIYTETLPKNGKACLGDVIYRCITSEHFSSECLLDCLDLSTEHAALDIANRLEAAINLWKKRATNGSPAKSSWEIVKELVVDGGDKTDLLAERAESLLLCLRQRFPCLSQTDLDVSKIQCNKDVGKSILESYSRVLESLAFKIVARINDLLYVDDISKHSDKTSMIGHRKVLVPYSVPISSSPYRTAFTTPNFSPERSERSPHLGGYGSKPSPLCGLGVRRVLANDLELEGGVKVKN